MACSKLNQNFHLLQFSDEILLRILSHLNGGDLVNCSIAFPKLDALILDKSICNDSLTLQWYDNLEKESITEFFRHPNRSDFITQLNFNDLYWLPSYFLRDVVKKVKNLRELYIAGTALSWEHLFDILKSPTPKSKRKHVLQSLSYTWDSFKLSKVQKDQIREVAPALEQLKFLLVQIPEIYELNTIVFSLYSSLSYFIAKCTNLEQLYLLSWPKSFEEVVFAPSSILETDEDAEIERATFPFLHTFVFKVLENMPMYSLDIITIVLKSLAENCKNPDYTLKTLWLDYYFMAKHLGELAPDDDNQEHPVINLNKTVSLSLPIVQNSTELFPVMDFEKCTKLQITRGTQNIMAANGFPDNVHNLESICTKKIDRALDWSTLISNNPNLRSINVCEDLKVPYPGFCLALQNLEKLTKLSVPAYLLNEIKDSEASAGTSAQVDNSSSGSSSNDDGPSTSKKRRIGIQTVPMSSRTTTNGIDIITKSLPEIDEFEIFGRYCGGKLKPGNALTDSLFSIAKWTKLKKLTLDDIPITSGRFLIEIAKSCPLESLRLSHLGPKAKCNYVDDLVKALALCKKLIDFRFEQHVIGYPRDIFKALESNKLLRRVVVFVETNFHPLGADDLQNLMQACPDLSVLYVTIDHTTKKLCEAITKDIEKLYKESRPTLSVMVKNTNKVDRFECERPPEYPSVHFRELVLCLPQVCGSKDVFVGEI